MNEIQLKLAANLFYIAMKGSSKEKPLYFEFDGEKQSINLFGYNSIMSRTFYRDLNMHIELKELADNQAYETYKELLQKFIQ